MAKAAPIFPLRDSWLPLLPALPLMLAAVLLSGLLPTPQDSENPLVFLASDSNHFIDPSQRHYVHLGDMLAYYSLVAFHTLLCAGVIATFARWMCDLGRRRIQGAAVFLGAVAMIIVAIGIFFGVEANRQVLVLLGYKSICQLMASANLPTQLVGVNQCYADGITHLTVLAWIPTFAGMATVAFASAFAYSTACDLQQRDAESDRNSPEWRESLEQRIKTLQRSVYLLSAVLVSSTITITVFAHLPVGLLKSGDEIALAASVSKFATGLSTFWGALFSITLVATFAAPALRLLNEAYGRRTVLRDSPEFRLWLHEHVFQSIKRQLGTVLSLMAPLLVGPVSSLLSSFSGL